MTQMARALDVTFVESVVSAVEAQMRRASRDLVEVNRFDQDSGIIGWQLQFDVATSPGEVLANGSDLHNPRCKYDFELLAALWNNREVLLQAARQSVLLEQSALESTPEPFEEKCDIPSHLVGACDLPFGHEDEQHSNSGDGFYARDLLHWNQKQQRIRRLIARLEERLAANAAMARGRLAALEAACASAEQLAAENREARRLLAAALDSFDDAAPDEDAAWTRAARELLEAIP